MRTAERLLWSAWCKHRDERAFEALVQPHLAFAVDHARRLGCNRHDADDLVQQALLGLAASRNGRPADVGVRAWLCRKVSLGARTQRRSRIRRTRHEAHAPVRAGATIAVVDDRDEVDAALDCLEPDERHAVALRFLHDLEYSEVAHVMGMRPAACRLRVHRALRRLRSRLGRNATTLLATCALLQGARPAHALVPARLSSVWGGVVIMGKATKIAVVAALAMLLTWVVARPNRTEPERAARDAALGEAHTESESDSAENGPAAAKPADVSATAAPTAGSVSANDWRDYDSLRALGRLTGRMRRLEKLVSAMGLGADEKPPRRADATTRLYLEELIAKYRSLPEGFARSKVLQQFMTAHNRYALRTGDPGFLGFVKGVARDGGAMERAVAIGGLSGLSAAPVVDLLIAALRHDDAPVRAAAVGALAQVSGGEAARGHRAIVVGIADDAPEVRWTTALQLEFAVRDPGNVEALLQRIPVETHPIAMHALVSAVLSLDPDDGRARIERSLDGAPAPVRDVGARALARKPEATTFTPPKVPAVGTDAKPRSDDTTRRYLKRLAAEFLAMSTGPDRLEHLKTIARTHGEYLRQTGDTSLLKMLDALVQAASTADERRAVIHSFVAPRKKAVVDQLVAWSADAHADVRAAAASSLSMVRGGEQSRAQNTIVGLLDDKEQSVRQHAAMFLGGFRDASVIPLLLRALADETDFAVVYAIVTTVLKLDAKAKQRIEDAVAEAAAATRAHVERTLKSLDR